LQQRPTVFALFRHLVSSARNRIPGSKAAIPIRNNTEQTVKNFRFDKDFATSKA
jgi:hypothetical protein